MKLCQDCLRRIATPEQWSGPQAHASGCECIVCVDTCWGCDADTAAQARSRAKLADLERRTVEFLEKGFGESSTCPNGCDCNDCRARALLAEWKGIGR